MGLYLHGSSEREQARLDRQSGLIDRRSLATLRLGGERRVLDLGCGTGRFTREIAAALGPEAHVLGIERDPRQIEAARLLGAAHPAAGQVELREGRAEDPPLAPDEVGSFDLAHARFLLEHHEDPLAVVRAMVRAVCPGGRVVLADDDHDVLRMWPEPPAFLALWRAYTRLYVENGTDPYVGRRLVALLSEAGAEPARNDWIFYGSCAGSPEHAALLENVAGFIGGTREALFAAGLAKADEVERGLAELARWGELQDGALWYAISWAEGRRPR